MAERSAIEWTDDANVWLGTPCEDQATVDERIPHLLATPAAVRFVSLELRGPIDLTSMAHDARESINALVGVHHGVPVDGGNGRTSIGAVRMSALDWVIVGGESGPGARPMHPDWVRSIRNQCITAGVPFFFKQWGEWIHEKEMVLVPETGGIVPAHQIFTCGDDDRACHDWPDGSLSYRVGKKRAGRLLDGRTWDEMPGDGRMRPQRGGDA